MSDEVVFVTGNSNKLAEVQAILGDFIRISSESLDLLEIQASIAEIAIHKSQEAFRKLKRPVLVEDTSLVFDAFNGDLPGPYIKWFLASLGAEGVCRMLDGFATRAAEAVCTFAYCDSNTTGPVLFQGRCRGRISLHPQGTTSFGWDSIFIPDAFTDRAFSEITKEQKNSISHRRHALDKVKAYFANIS